MKKRVFVGMSGGVDSSLSAALLVEQNFDVVGVYMKNWTRDLPGMKCPWAADLSDAKRVAVQLGIDFRVFDFQTEYKNLVVDYMISEYEKGRTPNPDIMCNQEVKFGIFAKAAFENGADFIATGHYARNLIREKNSKIISKSANPKFKMYLGSYKPWETGEDFAKCVEMVGEKKKVAIIMNAQDIYAWSEKSAQNLRDTSDFFAKFNLESENLDLREYFGAPEKLAKKLEKFGLIYVCGGNTFALRRAFAQSGFDRILPEFLEKGVVYAGFSAGSCLLAPSLRGLDITDDPNIIPENYDEKIIWDGLNLIDFVIEPHFRSNHKESPTIEIEVQNRIKNGENLETLRDGDVIIISGGKIEKIEISRNFLARAKCEEKDQTYFLYRIDEKILAKTLFPIGDFATKNDVRAAAEQRGISTARKKDSQGICFVGEVGIREFLANYVKTSRGNIVEKETGKILGAHDGAIFYTFGQRHGLNLGGGFPFYVVGKNMGLNEVYVSRNLNSREFWREEIELSDAHWISEFPRENEKYLARFRHRGKLVECEFAENSAREKTAKIKLSEPQRAVAPGQSVVIYSGEICLGGGIVK